MPELPEVETVRMGLLPVLEGHTIIHAETRRGDLRVPFPPRFAERLTGRRVTRVERRAKYILAHLSDGETLVIHLGMSGSMAVMRTGDARMLARYHHDKGKPGFGMGKHDHVLIDTDAPARIVFNDPRRFGLMTLIETDKIAEHKLFRDVGIEPLSRGLNAAYLSKALHGKKTPVKSALLDQRLIAGLGNIYVCEALWRGHVSPKRMAGAVKESEIAPLARAIKAVLADAVKAGGSSLRDHKRTDGEMGYFQHNFAVYGRTGKPCHTRGCKGTIKRIVQAGRSSFYCPVCQK